MISHTDLQHRRSIKNMHQTASHQRRRQSTGTSGDGQFFLGEAHGERMEHEPQRDPGAEPLVRGHSPPEAESFLALGYATDRENLYPTVCSIFSNPLQ